MEKLYRMGQRERVRKREGGGIRPAGERKTCKIEIDGQIGERDSSVGKRYKAG
jgi:hypothetical protein